MIGYNNTNTRWTKLFTFQPNENCGSDKNYYNSQSRPKELEKAIKLFENFFELLTRFKAQQAHQQYIANGFTK